MKQKLSGLRADTQKEYILCFPPKEQLAGNFFSQIKRVFWWKPVPQNSYRYGTAQRAQEDGGEDKTTVCLFMNSMPRPRKGEWLAQWLIGRRVREFAENYETPACKLHEMTSGQDYPYSLRLYLASDFWAHIAFGRRTHIGVIDGDALAKRDIIALIRQSYDKMNYLTIFSDEPAAYQELAQDAWEQFGLAVTVTKSLRETAFCNYILDCTTEPAPERIVCPKGCFFFAVCTGAGKMRNIRRMGEDIRFDSCAASLDRAFHNKV